MGFTACARPRRRRATRGAVLVTGLGLLTAGCVVDLGALEEDQSAGVEAINDAGVVVGWADDAGNGVHAFRKLPGGPMVELDGGPDADVNALGVNNAGVAVGYSLDDEFVAVLWELDGTMVDLNAGPDSAASDINDSGTIVGRTGDDAFVRAPSGEVTILGRVYQNGRQGATAVNDDGVVVGYAVQAGQGLVPVVWAPPRYTGVVLPLRDGGAGAAWDINDHGDVVGGAGDQGSQSPVLWRAGSFERVELPLGPYARGEATGVNDAGQIVGNMNKGPGGTVAVRWDSPDASPVSLGGLGGGTSFVEDVNEDGDAVGSAYVRERTPDGRQTVHAVLYPNDG